MKDILRKRTDVEVVSKIEEIMSSDLTPKWKILQINAVTKTYYKNLEKDLDLVNTHLCL
jgi:hypothetical protein